MITKYSSQIKDKEFLIFNFIDYQTLPLKDERFEDHYKWVYEESLELIEKIPNFSRVSKTRGNVNNQEQIKMVDALDILSQI